MKRIWYILLFVYLILYATILTPYVAVVDQSKQSIPAQYLMGLQWFIPSLLLVFLIPGVAKIAKPIFNIRFWTVIGLILLTICVVLELTKRAGLWWSWSTIGLAAVIFVVVINETKSVLVGAASVLLGLGIFEILYQTGLAFYWQFFGNGFVNYVVVVAENLLWVIPSIVIIVVSRKKVSFNLSTAICLSVLILCTVVWFINGMDIPLKWYLGTGPFDAHPRDLFLAISRGSQGFCCASVATLFLRCKK